MIIIHFFLSISGLKGYFEEHYGESYILFGPKNTKYLTIIFTNQYQKFMYKEILIKINKDFNRNYVKIKFESNDNYDKRQLWAAPARLVNLLNFKPEKLSIETESNANNVGKFIM